MNIYFVFEGKTEPKVYKKWLSYLLPQLSEVQNFEDVAKNNYFYQSDMGIPNCYNVTATAIQEINEKPHYNYLVLCIDADRFEVEEAEIYAKEKIEKSLNTLSNGHKYKKLPDNCELLIIVQKVCIETWFLGNNRFIPNQIKGERLKEYLAYFDVRTENPEDLAQEFKQNEDGTARIFNYSTKALLHEGYLREIFKERLGYAFSKSNPKEVDKKNYLNELLRRTEKEPTHLETFQSFIQFCKKIEKFIVD